MKQSYWYFVLLNLYALVPAMDLVPEKPVFPVSMKEQESTGDVWVSKKYLYKLALKKTDLISQKERVEWFGSPKELVWNDLKPKFQKVVQREYHYWLYKEFCQKNGLNHRIVHSLDAYIGAQNDAYPAFMISRNKLIANIERVAWVRAVLQYCDSDVQHLIKGILYDKYSLECMHSAGYENLIHEFSCKDPVRLLACGHGMVIKSGVSKQAHICRLQKNSLLCLGSLELPDQVSSVAITKDRLLVSTIQGLVYQGVFQFIKKPICIAPINELRCTYILKLTKPLEGCFAGLADGLFTLFWKEDSEWKQKQYISEAGKPISAIQMGCRVLYSVGQGLVLCNVCKEYDSSGIAKYRRTERNFFQPLIGFLKNYQDGININLCLTLII